MIRGRSLYKRTQLPLDRKRRQKRKSLNKNASHREQMLKSRPQRKKGLSLFAVFPRETLVISNFIVHDHRPRAPSHRSPVKDDDDNLPRKIVVCNTDGRSKVVTRSACRARASRPHVRARVVHFAVSNTSRARLSSRRHNTKPEACKITGESCKCQLTEIKLTLRRAKKEM